MDFMRKFWNNFKTQPDRWFFYGFLATFTLSIRKVLFFYPINNRFNEYTGIYLYLSDILLILAILIWVIVLLCNKYSILSILKTTNVPPRENCSTWNNFRGKRGTILIPAILVIWSFISILWSANPNLALFRSFKLLEFYLLFLYIIVRIVPRGTIFKNSFQIIIATGAIQSIIGIWQVIIQHSIGFNWLKESLISPDTLGVAKTILDNNKIVRAYGLFPHPNILGGFLFLSILLTILYYKMFHVEQLLNSTNPNSAIKCSTWNNGQCEVYNKKHHIKTLLERMFHMEQFFQDNKFIKSISKINPTSIYYAILTIQIVAIFLTFSKSAIISLFIVLFYINRKSIVPCPPRVDEWSSPRVEADGTIVTLQIRKMFHVEHFNRKLLLILSIFIALIVITKPNIDSLLFKSLRERMIYTNVSRGTILNNPVFGVGSGQFVTTMQAYTNQTLSDWQFQPVHNVFLLIWSELGLIGFSLFMLILWKLFHARLASTSGRLHESRRVEHSKKSISDIKCSTWNNHHCEVYTKKQNVPRPPRVDKWPSPRVEAGGTLSDVLSMQKIFKGLLLGFLFIMLFDHYLWDIQQGQIMLWLIFGLIVGSNRRDIDK
jgi:hypothetical protein